MLNFLYLAEKKARLTKRSRELWARVLESKMSTTTATSLGEENFLKLLDACHTPAQFELMAQTLNRESSPEAQNASLFLLLTESIDESPYAFEDWIAAWEHFSRWLKEQQREASFASILGYLNCCIESVADKPFPPSLRELVEEMLASYGFDG